MAIINKKKKKKKNIIKSIFLNIGISSLYASKIVNDLISILISNLSLNKNLKIKNFGTFKLQKKNKRMGRNPKSKKSYEITERKIVSFNTAENLMKKINNNVKKY